MLNTVLVAPQVDVARLTSKFVESLYTNPLCKVFCNQWLRTGGIRAQMDEIKRRKLYFDYVKFTTNGSTTYIVIQLPIEKLPSAATQCLFYGFSTSDNAHLHPEVAIILQFSLP